MIPSRIDLPLERRRAAALLLAAALADAMDLHSHAKHAHWNVRGPNFYALHQLFDAVAEGAEGFADELAERLAAFGGYVPGTTRDVLAATQLRAYPPATSWRDHVNAVANSLAQFGAMVRRSIDTAGQAGDQGTADLFTEISRENDKLLWMVEAHLQE